jgi:diacylglycerol kinase family enzyme
MAPAFFCGISVSRCIGTSVRQETTRLPICRYCGKPNYRNIEYRNTAPAITIVASMRRVLLLYNPVSGRGGARRVRDVEAAASVFRAAGIECIVEATQGRNTAAEQARAAIAAGCDAVIVCGGDGTANEALHGIVGTPAALGVIPLGTGNGLANDLGLPRDPAAAARLLAAGVTRPIRLPRVEYLRTMGHASPIRGPAGQRPAPRRATPHRPAPQAQWRYFLITAGIGADAEMVYRLATNTKRRWGMAAYYAASARRWLTYEFPLFTAEFRDAAGQWRSEEVSQVLAVRIHYFGGVLKCMAPRADLFGPSMELVLFKTRSRLTYLRYVLSIWSGRHWAVPGVEFVTASECRCTGAARVYAEADGELLGRLPITMRMTDATVKLLAPSAVATKTQPPGTPRNAMEN